MGAVQLLLSLSGACACASYPQPCSMMVVGLFLASLLPSDAQPVTQTSYDSAQAHVCLAEEGLEVREHWSAQLTWPPAACNPQTLRGKAYRHAGGRCGPSVLLHRVSPGDLHSNSSNACIASGYLLCMDAIKALQSLLTKRSTPCPDQIFHR